MVVVRDEDRFLLVHEAGHGQQWYVPAGRVEPGETVARAAHRETLEEAGVRIVLEGVLRVEHTPHPEGTARCRVVFVARPETPGAVPKSVPDAESLEARWVRLDEVAALRLRSPEVPALLRAVAAGAPVAPLSLLGTEA